MDLSVVIINWNSAAYLEQCLRSLYAHTQGVEMEVIVLDNASFDGSRELVERQFSQVGFIQSEQNLGFAKGNNVAVKHASGGLLLFLNPDTEVRGPAITHLLDAAKSVPRPGALGARLLNADGTLQTSCVEAFPTIANQILDSNMARRWFPKAHLWGSAALYSNSTTPVVVDRVSGACLMTPRLVFNQVGGFDEHYFMYADDLEYCLKVHRAGYRNYYVPEAELVHYGGKSSSQAPGHFASVMMAESSWQFFRREYGPMRARLYRCSLAVRAVSRLCLLAPACLLPWRQNRRRKLNNLLSRYLSVLRWAAGAERCLADR